VAYPPAAPEAAQGTLVAPAVLRERSALGALRAVTRRPRTLAFVLYVALGLLTAGWYAISDPTRVCACIGNGDPATSMWGLEWFPHAILHGLNPLVSHVVWAPTGDNLARRAVIPAAALLVWPVTALFGPIVAYNVLSVGCPVLAAFTAYLLCRRIAGRELPALVGGYIFGFGPYMFSQLLGHMNLTLVFLVPVMVHLALRRTEREISARTYVLALAAVFVVQIGFSTEVLATAAGFGFVAIILARLLAPEPYPGRIQRLLAETIGAGLLAVLIASPFLYYALIKGGLPTELPNISDAYGLDLLNPFFPTGTTWLGNQVFAHLTATFEGANAAEADGYLGIALMFAFALWASGTRRRFLARMLSAMTLLSFLVALGSHIHVAGIQTLGLPYVWIQSLPVVRLITPSRISLYTLLVVATGVACWLSEAPPFARRGADTLLASGRTQVLRAASRWVLVALAVVMIFPNIASRQWGGTVSNPAFFRGTAYRHYLTRGEMILALPYGPNANSMLWQAETGFYFRMPEGYLGHYAPPVFQGQAVVNKLVANKVVKPAKLLRFIHRYDVRDIVIEAASPSPYEAELDALGFHGLAVGGVLLYRVS
jgi:hypothetical protein